MKTFRQIVFFLISTVFSTTIHAQEAAIRYDSASRSLNVYNQPAGAEMHLPAVKTKPEYRGGKSAWQDFLRKNINIKTIFANKPAPGKYDIMIRFIIANDGSIKNAGAETDAGYGIEKEVIRCILLSRAWNPAITANAVKVNFTLRQIIHFTIKPNDIEISF